MFRARPQTSSLGHRAVRHSGGRPGATSGPSWMSAQVAVGGGYLAVQQEVVAGDEPTKGPISSAPAPPTSSGEPAQPAWPKSRPACSPINGQFLPGPRSDLTPGKFDQGMVSPHSTRQAVRGLVRSNFVPTEPVAASMACDPFRVGPASSTAYSMSARNPGSMRRGKISVRRFNHLGRNSLFR